MNLQSIKKEYTIDDFCRDCGIELFPFQKIFLEYLIKNPNKFIYYSGVRNSRYYLNGLYETIEKVLKEKRDKE